MQVSSINIVFYRWLEPFLESIKEKGFTVTPDTHIQLLKVLNGMSDKIDSPAVLFDYISPLLAKSNEERLLLKQEFDAYFYQPFLKIKETPTRRYPYIFLGVDLLLIFFFILLVYPWPAHSEAESKYQIQYNNLNQPVVFSAGAGFKNLDDTVYADYKWDFGDGNVDSSGHPTVTHLYSKPGSYKTSLTLSGKSDKIRITKAFKEQEIKICKPQVFLMSDAGYELALGGSANFYPVYDSLYPASGENVWMLNGKVLQKNAPGFTYKFDSAGLQTVSYIDSKYYEITDCIVQADKPVYVKASSAISLNIIQAGDIINPPVKLNSTFLVLIMILFGCTLFAYIWLRSKIAAQRRKDMIKPADILSSFAGMQSPYEIPFKNKDDVIDDEPYLNNLTRKLKRRMPDESHFINVPLTIAETIKADGLIIPYWSYQTRPVEYIVLIDKTKANNQQVKLFDYLLKRFSRSDLFIEKFYFSSQPEICTNDQYRSGIHVSRLYDIYPNHVLIIFGDGYSFISKFYPSLNNELASLFKKWEYATIFTPKPYKDWNYKEEILQRGFVLLPADLEGQLMLFALQEGVEDNYQEYYNLISATYRLQPYDLNEVDDIKTYLSDPFLFQWLCAITIYPSVHWEVLLGIGDALQKEAFPNRSINYTNLLKLVRIDWMREGSMPDDTRLELLKQLEPQNEIIARKAMIVLMNEAAASLKEKSFVYEQMQLQRMTDKFMLYAQDPDIPEHKEYKQAYEQFKILWKGDKILDYPLTTYLNKEEGANWTTLIGNKSLSGEPTDSKSIDDFFDDGQPLIQKRWQQLQRASLLLSILLPVLLVAVFAFRNKINNTAIDKKLSLTAINNKIAFSFGFQPNECLSAVQQQKDSVGFMLDFEGGGIPINPGDTLFDFEIPYQWIKNGNAVLTVRSTNPQYNIDSSIKLTGNSVRIQFTGCPVVCTNWQAERSNTMPSFFTGTWYMVDMINGNADAYTPLNIDPSRIGSDSISNIYTCANNRQLYRIITRTLYNEFKSYSISRIQGQQTINLSSNGRLYKAASEAVADTLNQAGLSMFTLNKTTWKAISNDDLIKTFKGAWKRNEKTGNITFQVSDNNISYKGANWQIKNPAAQTVAGKTFYSTVLVGNKNNPGNVDSILVYALIANSNKILLSEEALHAPAADANDTANNGWVSRQKGFIAFAKADTAQISITNEKLPASLSEIWKGGTSNRLININLTQNKIYYSTGDNKTYGTYNINEVSKTSSGVYKIITQTDKGFKVFFIKNAGMQSFDLSVCQALYNTKEAISNIDETYCDKFNTMKWYYENDPEKIYLPAKGNQFADLEQKKLNKKIDSINVGYGYGIIFSNSNRDAGFISKATIRQLLIDQKIPIDQNTKYSEILSPANPLQRNFFYIKIEAGTKGPVQNTATLSPELKSEYQLNFDNCKPTGIAVKEIENIIYNITGQEKVRYENVAKSTGIPWYFIGILHYMESGGKFNVNMEDGKPLANLKPSMENGKTVFILTQSKSPRKSKTTKAPNTPDSSVAQKTPVTWEESTAQYLNLSWLSKWYDWSIPGVLYCFEKFNGFGYRKNGIFSPYVWGGSNIYRKGQFTSGANYDPNLVSPLIGAGVILKVMDEKGLLSAPKSAK
ncbi:hypothetical protein BH10BAC3_BH10BAC3_12710 [soil metagenome]